MIRIMCKQWIVALMLSLASVLVVAQSDVVVVPPSGGSFVVKDSTGANVRFQVNESGEIIIPSLPRTGAGQSLCRDEATGEIIGCSGGDFVWNAGDIEGRITVCGSPQSDVQVYIRGSSYDARTDSGGGFRISYVQQGTHDLTVMGLENEFFGAISPVVVVKNQVVNVGDNNFCLDADGDGYNAIQDCDDENPAVHPGAVESCDDGVDNDCDGQVDNVAICTPVLECEDISCTNEDCSSFEITLKPGWCRIDGACYTDGAGNSENSCQLCNASNAPLGWSDQFDGTSCNDGVSCSFDDVCSSGQCGGTPYSCDDGNSCTLDVCSGDGACGFESIPGCG